MLGQELPVASLLQFPNVYCLGIILIGVVNYVLSMVTREPVSPVFEPLLLNVFYDYCGTVLREFCVCQIRCVLSNKLWSVMSVTVFVGYKLRVFDCPVGTRAHHTMKVSCLSKSSFLLE